MREGAIKIIKHIQQHNYHALLVGGAVRDELMGVKPKDYDIVTSCPMERLKEIFPDTIAVGEAFGVLIINKHFEIAQFRIDRYLDGKVQPMGLRDERHSLEELIELDSARRDLTFGAIYYDPISENYYDPQDGRKDITEGTIRFVGEAQDRIKEDPIRLLRFYRFGAKYPHMDHHWADWDDVEFMGEELERVSKERIFEELKKILMECHNLSYGDFRQICFSLKTIIPELNQMESIEQNPIWHYEGNVLIHTWKALTQLRVITPENVFAVLLHDVGKIRTTKVREGKITHYNHENVGAEMAERILRDLKCSKKFVEKVTYLVKNHMRIKEVRKMRKGKVIDIIKHKWYDDLKEISAADSMGSTGNLGWYHWLTEFEKSDHYPKGEVPSLITGKDLTEQGLTPGPEYKDLIKKARLIQLENPNMKKEKILLDIISKV